MVEVFLDSIEPVAVYYVVLGTNFVVGAEV